MKLLKRIISIFLILLLIDPLYLSALCGLFGGGDMNGIALLCPEWAVRCLSGALLIANALVFWRRIFQSTGSRFPKEGRLDRSGGMG